MQEENRNDKANWKREMQELRAAENYNKNAAWEKLHAHIQENSLKAKAMWYWLAAACTVFAIVFSVFIYFQNNNAESKQILTRSALKNNTSRLVADTLHAFTLHKNLLHKAIAVSKMFNPKHNHKYQPEPLAKFRMQDNVTLQTKSFIEKDVSLKRDTLLKVLAVNATKKRLPIIHINEIENAPQYQADVAHNPSEHAFEFHFATQQFFVNTSTGKSITQGFTIIKSETFSK